MEFFKKYKKKYGKMFSLALVFLTFEALCDLMQPTIMARIIDVGVANRDLGYVLRKGGLMLLITLFGALSASTRNVISSSVSQTSERSCARICFGVFKACHLQMLTALIEPRLLRG
ncbi:hypothetical protein ACFQDF_18415 [Ectobacillus funiculus]